MSETINRGELLALTTEMFQRMSATMPSSGGESPR